MIQIRPTADLRRGFARWAVAQTPKVRTVSTHAFAVPPDLFAGMPEELLIGALVDGRRYVSPDEDAQVGNQPPARLLKCGTCYEEDGEEVHPHPECPLVGVATEGGFREAVAGGWLPEVPAEAYGPDSVPLPELPEDSDASHSAPEVPEGVFPCSGCEREFTTQRGRDMHHRQKHAED